MKHKLEIIRRILFLIYEALFTILLTYFVEMILVKESPHSATVIIILCLYIASYSIRERATNYGMILLFHMILLGIVFAIPIGIGLKGVLTVVIVYQLSESFSYARRGSVLKRLNDVPWPTFLICFVICLYGNYTDSREIIILSNIIPILLLFIYLLMVYSEGLLNYIDSTKDVSGLPLKNIVSTNSLMVIVILCFLMVALLLGRILKLDYILIKLGAGILVIIKIITYAVKFLLTMFGRMLRFGGGEESEVFELSGGQSVDYINTMNSFAEVILKLALLALAIYIVYRIAKKVIKVLMQSRPLSGDIHEEAEIKNSSSVENVKRRLFKIRLSKEERARRYYRLRMMSYKYDISLRKDKTCRELQTEIEEQELGDVSEITELYSDIRYGNLTVDRNILRKMNRLSRK